ncbi:MAG: ATP-binding cassette domain-containing protein [Chloroflexi bacterium]|nr:ATP-binding cassette domain-containing protein [Chloroflexota bacterium]
MQENPRPAGSSRPDSAGQPGASDASDTAGGSTGPADRPYIYANDVFKIFKVADLEVVALRGLDLKVEKGEIVAIIGSSGSGKSTLLNILAGYDTPSAGTIYVGDYDMLNMTSKEVVEYRRNEVGFVWQQTARNLFPYLSAIENVELPMMLAGRGSAHRRKRATDLLALVGLGGRMNHKPEHLSGGEQQRVAIAVALANEPPLLLADEPTGELDDETGAEILELLNHLNVDTGTTIVVVTHDPAISASVGRAIAIRDGKTSTEIRRVVEGQQQIGGEAVGVEEFLLVDTSGRVQIPREMIDELNLGERLRVEIVDGRVTLRDIDADDAEKK